MISVMDKVCWLRQPLVLLAFFLGSSTSAVAQTTTIAMVTDLQGRATITAQGVSRDASILTEIPANAQLQIGEGATLVALYLDSGNEYHFRGPSRIVLEASGPEVKSGSQGEKRMPSLGSGVRIRPVGIGQGALVLRSGSPIARIQLMSLSGTKTLDVQPVFQWQELQPGVKYQLDISDETGQSLIEAQTDQTSFRLPQALQLKAGSSYIWEVTARLPDGRKYSSVGLFSVAGDELRAQVQALRVDASAPVSVRVAYAAWLHQVELKDEARKYWRVLLSERPDESQLKALAYER